MREYSQSKDDFDAEMEQIGIEIARKSAAGDAGIPDVFKPQTKEEPYADLELALEQVKRGEGIPIEQFE